MFLRPSLLKTATPAKPPQPFIGIASDAEGTSSFSPGSEVG